MTEYSIHSLRYSKGRNCVRNPDTDAEQVTRIIRCLGDHALDTPVDKRTGKGSCNRMVAEYEHVAIEPTFHRDGIPEDVIKIALKAGAAVVDALCDHHGGHPYERYAELIPTVEKNAV